MGMPNIDRCLQDADYMIYTDSKEILSELQSRFKLNGKLGNSIYQINESMYSQRCVTCPFNYNIADNGKEKEYYCINKELLNMRG